MFGNWQLSELCVCFFLDVFICYVFGGGGVIRVISIYKLVSYLVGFF